jgi:BMFP domain-containing protein YqiC
MSAGHAQKERTMTAPRILEEISAKLSELAANSPAKDIEKNVKALLGSAFGKLDLVTREEFEVQREMLLHARQKLFELEERIAALEAEQQRAAGGGDEREFS